MHSRLSNPRLNPKMELLIKKLARVFLRVS